MRILYYDCFAGISGDMNLGALIDLGVDAAYLSAELEKLGIEGFRLSVKRDHRKHIYGTKADVVIKNPKKEKHRHWQHIEEIICKSTLQEPVKELALKIFNRVAEAEAKVHNCLKEKVHFHEVGALDSIVDIVGAAICLTYLHVDKVISSPVQLGSGTVKCAHGVMPVPAPATAEIVKNIPVKVGLVAYEATTPTGAAILAATVDEFTEACRFRIVRTGCGLGTIDKEIPNILRVFLCEDGEGSEETPDVTTEEVALLECNIDDMNPEHYDFLLERLLQAGANDAWMTPVIMKKSRPAVQLSVLCKPSAKEAMQAILFTHSASIGVRCQTLSRDVLRREECCVETPYGKVRVKQSYYKGTLVNAKPESDDCRRLAEQHQVSLSEIEKSVIQYGKQND
jgi:uncharacterized protein (TIGR00299 family) protein